MIPLPVLLRLKRGPILGRSAVVGKRREQVTATRRADGGWSFTFPVGLAPYRVLLDGKEIDTTETESYEFLRSGYDDEAPPLEFVSAEATGDGERYPPYVRLQWRGLQNADAYLVEQYVSSAWATRVTLRENGSGYYSWSSLAQTDGDATQWRVSALSPKQSAGTPISFTFTIVRNPAPPSSSFSISGGTLTVAAG